MLQNVEKYNPPLLFSLIVLNLLDFITTYFCIALGAEEANPILAGLMVMTGTVWVILYVKLVIILTLIPFFSIGVRYPELIQQYVRPTFPKFVAWLLIVVNTFYIYIVVNNVIIINILSDYR